MKVGSSPHTRGAPRGSSSTWPDVRIIPAYAGSTVRGGNYQLEATDHPRIRGEHAGARAYTPSRPGSSPHTRGALRRPPRLGCAVRIIPAYAGSTSLGLPTTTRRTDHPRIRGEHIGASDNHDATVGSSPHTRGALGDRRRLGPGGGIIPAYAGSTSLATSRLPTKPDHPRIRGEHTTVSIAKGEAGGSSPHTRGAQSNWSQRAQCTGIIPAYAGSTSLARGGFGRPADHPRIRGEHASVDYRDRLMTGSSPHTRGALVDGLLQVPEGRIIPAYAGSTVKIWSTPSTNAGSSPHTRGARQRGARCYQERRIIPAYAGSTVEPSEMLTAQKDHPRIRGEHHTKGDVKSFE